mmetsp:Transcript_12834/g.20942  ORF Transcript_12834/g.20942 Transcript_12834/m.20942 type:complete len:401 (-) Transcript_12834:1477-2679(-)
MSDSLLPQSTSSLARVLLKVLSFPTNTACVAYLSNTKGKNKINAKQRQQLCELSGVEHDWIHCDQKVAGNVQDLASFICSELYEPYQFYIQALQLNANNGDHQRATVPLSKRRKFWSAWNEMKTYSWLPPRACTYDAVVHFIQEGSGTGVHVGGGLILTCAHVVDSRDDCDDIIPCRIGRMKTIMFPSGSVFLARCVAVTEGENGILDSAALRICALVMDFPAASYGDCDSSVDYDLLPVATVSSTPAVAGTELLCIGNPSSIDLESVASNKNIEFDPPTWHTSVGSVISSEDGQLMTHSCWTYWGHSGAPLFNSSGEIVGLHCAWDDGSGIRQAQRLETLLETLRSLSFGTNKDTNCEENCTSSTSSDASKTIRTRKRKNNECENELARCDIIDLTDKE